MGLIKNIFSKRKPLVLADLSVLECDIHSHLIPGIDDGSQSLEESVDLIKELVKLGYTKLITTPHVMSDHFQNTPSIIRSGLKELRRKLSEEKIAIQIEVAAEYYSDYNFQKKIGAEELLTFGDNYILFELSYFNPPQHLNESIFQLQTNNYKPILAHPERYMYWHKDFDRYIELKDKGVLFQVNINSLSKRANPSTRKMAEKLIANEMVEFLGSDVHNMQYIERIHDALSNPYLTQALSSGKLLNNSIYS